MGTDETAFTLVLCSRSFAQLRATFERYKAVTGHDLARTIESETSGDLREGYLAIGQCPRSFSTLTIC